MWIDNLKRHPPKSGFYLVVVYSRLRFSADIDYQEASKFFAVKYYDRVQRAFICFDTDTHNNFVAYWADTLISAPLEFPEE